MMDAINRRDFIRATTAASAGLALADPVSVRAQADSDVIRLGLIGAGIQGENLVNACLGSWEGSRVRFEAVCDLWVDLNLARMVELLEKFDHSPRAYTDYRRMLETEKNLDAVLIATPDCWHADHTVASLESGLHVYCEAPIANRLEPARRMVKAARQTGKLLQIGYQRRSNPRYRHALEKLIQAARLLGRVTAAYGQCNLPVQPDIGWSRRKALEDSILAEHGYRSMHAFKNWRWFKELGGGPLIDYGSHQIDILSWFLGTRPRSVTARGGTLFYDPKTHEWHDTVMAIYEYETRQGPVHAYYQIVTSSGYGGRYEVFMGDQGALEIAEGASRTGVYRDPRSPDWDKWVDLEFLRKPGATEEEPAPAGVIQAKETQPPPRYELAVELTDPYHTPHLRNFFDAIQGQAQLHCPGDLAYETLVTTLKVQEAIDADRTRPFAAEDFQT